MITNVMIAGVSKLDTNVDLGCWIGWKRMLWWIMNLIQVGFDCLSNLDNNVKDGYQCHDGLWIWYRLDSIFVSIWIRLSLLKTSMWNVDTGWIQMLRMDSWIEYELDLIVDPIRIRMLRMDTNVWYRNVKDG